MKNNNFFVDCHVFDKGFQGTRTYIKGLYSELMKDKTKHFFLAANNIENLQNSFGTSSNITFLKYKSTNAFVRLLFEIPYFIKKHKIYFAHFQYRVPPIKLCKYIITTHDVLFEDFPEYFPKLNRIQSFLTYKFSVHLSDIVFTVSQYSKNQIEKHLKVKDVIVMPNGIENIFFEEYDKNQIVEQVKEKFQVSNYLIFVSRWEPRKNHLLFLKLFVKLELFKNHDIVFIGDDTFVNKDYNEYFNSLSQTIKFKIKTLKRVSFDDMLLLLKGSKISVYPSIAEGFGIPPLESIAAKIPTITSNSTAMSDFDFLQDYSFDPKSETDFEKKLFKVINDEDYKIKEKQQIIKNRYNWNLSAQIFNESINNLITDS